MANKLRTKLARLRREGQITFAEYKTLSDMIEGQEKALRGSGMWICKCVDDMAVYVCNKCQRASIETSKFCPWCGREMGGTG